MFFFAQLLLSAILPALQALIACYASRIEIVPQFYSKLNVTFFIQGQATAALIVLNG